MKETCERICNLIPAYIQGKCSEAEFDVLDRHVRVCKECSDYYCLMFDLLTQGAEREEQ